MRFRTRVSTEEQRKEIAIKEKLESENQLADIRVVLDLKAGQRLIWRILSETGVYSRTYTLGDSTHSAFNEGRRDIGLWLLEELEKVDARAYLRLQHEAVAESERQKEVSHEST